MYALSKYMNSHTILPRAVGLPMRFRDPVFAFAGNVWEWHYDWDHPSRAFIVSDDLVEAREL